MRWQKPEPTGGGGRWPVSDLCARPRLGCLPRCCCGTGVADEAADGERLRLCDSADLEVCRLQWKGACDWSLALRVRALSCADGVRLGKPCDEEVAWLRGERNDVGCGAFAIGIVSLPWWDLAVAAAAAMREGGHPEAAGSCPQPTFVGFPGPPH